jgi:hypothetical protein
MYDCDITLIYLPLGFETTQNLILNWSGTLPDAADVPAEDEFNTRLPSF